MSNEEEKRSILERKRNVLMLMSQYLTDYGLVNTNEILLKESALLAATNREYMLCDNIDLDSIYLDYMSYHQLKFGRPPKLTKRIVESSVAGTTDEHGSSNLKKHSSTGSIAAARRKQQLRLQRSNALRSDVENAKDKILQQEPTTSLADALVVSQVPGQQSPTNDDAQHVAEAAVASLPLLRHHPHYSPDWASLADVICRDIVDGCTLNVGWDTIKGHADAKEKLIESVLSPLLYPQLFTAGGLRPWKAVLLHGPPGTGKTSLARALCKEAAGKATFFNISASTMVSKWRGDSEKLVRVMFDVAKYFAPSILFIDEVEGLMSKRDCAGEHEASKRFKNELLTHIDGLDEMRNVFVLGSTNLPWELDPAFLRRFERKLLLTMPDESARAAIIRELIPHSSGWSKDVWQEILRITEAFTGDELRIAHKETAMLIVRQTITQHREQLCDGRPSAMFRPITSEEFLRAVMHTKPASKALLQRYQVWHEEHGGT